MRVSRLLLICFSGFLLLLLSCSSGKKSGGRVDVVNTLEDPAFVPTKVKYARMMGVPPDSIKNRKLYTFIEEWINTPYKWGGTDKAGIDCSGFIQKLFQEVYNIDIPRTSVEQFFTQSVDKFRSVKFCSEGDLVFFRTADDKLISHVGVYLRNFMFVNSSSSKGVSIANLQDAYWKGNYVACGRLRVKDLKKLASR
jgi:lipoprotein Spr